MSSTTRRVMLRSGLMMVLGLGLSLGYLAYCNHRAAHPQDVLGVDRIAKPTGQAPSPDGDESAEAPVEYEYFNKLGVSNWHRVGAQIFYIVKGPAFALILVGVLLIARALLYKPRAPTRPTEPIDPLAD